MLKSILSLLIASASLAVVANGHAAAPAAPAPTEAGVTQYRTVTVNGLRIFYREAGPANAPTVLMLHGFPSSSRMFEPLFARLSTQYHLIAPDYPGFGHSDAPAATEFAYTFDNLARVVDGFTEAVGLQRYVLFMQDYGGPVGMRLAVAHPERVQALIVQNAVSHEDGLGPLWVKRREYWANRAANEAALRAAFLSLATTKQRHVGSNPHPETVDPDRWTDEFAFLSRPGQQDIQADLFYDYRTNVASYPAWGKWLRDHQPRSLVLWGKYDPSFEVAEVAAFQRDVPKAEVHVLDGGHFAINDRPDEIAQRVDTFLSRQPH
ncbi:MULTISPECIES: alpha/beta fold hydrolase [unclassified Cupriavidus]|uniref:alpha/beta fold hydrolase n=1 Tax=unclassified Cupriavidus TaxID=2640874 RepID=UPI00313E4ED9